MASSERTMAVLFADISGSTRLFEALGDVEAHRVVEVCLAAVRTSTGEYGGRVVKGTGDGLLCTFADEHSAVGAASEMQGRLELQRRSDPAIPPIRVGVAHGPVLEESSDVFGDTVNLAARLTALATAGQVLTNRAVAEALPLSLRSCCRELYDIALKGISHKVAVHEVVWKGDAELTMVTTSHGMGGRDMVAPRSLRLSYRERELRLPQHGAELRIGREPQCDLVIPSPMTSRRHARIRMYESNFVLVDESANGTFVRFEGRQELHLRREETILLGRGVIGFGASTLVEEASATFAVDGD